MKYIGSKSKLAKYIVPILQNILDKNPNIQYYVEPFVGGANVIDKIKFPHKYGFDIDEIPISVLHNFSKDETLFDKLPVEIVTREEYFHIRDNKEQYKDWYRSAVLLFASYNARVYGGCYGAVTETKDGKIRNYYKEAMNNLKKQIPNLKDIIFRQRDYRSIREIKDALIYCDPPYKNSIKYSTDFDHDEFWAWVREKSENNIVIVSEYEAPNDFKCIWQQDVITHLNNRNKLQKVEKLFVFENTGSINRIF